MCIYLATSYVRIYASIWLVYIVSMFFVSLSLSQHKQGEIRHVFRGNVFLVVRDQVENGGIVVCKAKHVELAGGTSHAVGPLSLSPYFNNPFQATDIQ